MKIKYPLIAAILLVFCFNTLYSQQVKHKPIYKILASYSPFTTALGKGKGIIFRITIAEKDKKHFTVDSFFVKNTPMKFRVIHTPVGEIVESNYLVNTPEPSLNSDGSTNKPSEVEDEIISKNIFNPSWLIINQAGKKTKILVDKYSELKQNPN